ncbi:hypothetical protein Arub01_17600 [Actinomadura rubrobrunea]|uniref:cystathionine gamma-lyase n=1 Tax=Actinomadura rubrobrunea TaxID=115335 RepID=A0A9W6PV18_9ACTN|nr:pyridoxal-phosphate dependent enzyme [Actinomadura rubrobrunea]GLW63516.1 hypothetical protein Arub01_17600 [Actinomadura rubrobrunea]
MSRVVDRCDPRSRAWIAEAIRKVEADAGRSADTHLHAFPLPPEWGVDLYLKDESVHPTGSLKHRLARSLFLYALANGWIREGTTIIEASSGSTAVSEAYFARLLGLPFVAVMPATTSREKIELIEFHGGRCHLVDDPRAIYDESRRLAQECGGHFMDQFTYAEFMVAHHVRDVRKQRPDMRRPPAAELATGGQLPRACRALASARGGLRSERRAVAADVPGTAGGQRQRGPTRQQPEPDHRDQRQRESHHARSPSPRRYARRRSTAATLPARIGSHAHSVSSLCVSRMHASRSGPNACGSTPAASSDGVGGCFSRATQKLPCGSYSGPSHLRDGASVAGPVRFISMG